MTADALRAAPTLRELSDELTRMANEQYSLNSYSRIILRKAAAALAAPQAAHPPEGAQTEPADGMAAMRADAERWRWLLQFLHVERTQEGSWTCWLSLDEIPFRSQTKEPTALLDALIARFPLDPDEGAQK